MKGIFAEPESATKEVLDGLWSDVQKLGSNRLEDCCARYIAAGFFQDEGMVKGASKRLESQLKVKSEKVKVGLTPAELELLLDCINMGERMAVNGVRIREFLQPVLATQQDERLLDYARRLDVMK